MSLYNKIIDLQKLTAAWQAVRKNRPACGVDEVTWQDFDINQKKELYQLHIELKERRYDSLPIRETVLYKGEKARNIALFSMRDKVVHQSVAVELQKIYEPLFGNNCFAYRPKKSALDAVSIVEQEVSRHEWALKLDICNFFDSIRQDRLLEVMHSQIGEEDVLELMRRILGAKKMDQKTGELVPKQTGIYQGSGLAPIWSNIYLMEFDAMMEEKTSFAVRYSDDMLFLGGSREELKQMETMAENYLVGIGLALSEHKKCLTLIKDGFEYLGYHFDKRGKAIGKKAEETLKERLEMMWMTSVNASASEKLQKGSEILGGWEQYYRPERVPGDILEYATALFMSQKKQGEFEDRYKSIRFQFDNPYPDLLEWLAGYWEKKGEPDYIRMEYEQYFHKSVYDTEVKIDSSSILFTELLSHYKRLLVHPDKEDYERLVQAYSDFGCYNKASAWQKDLEEFLQNKEGCIEMKPEPSWKPVQTPDDSGIRLMASLFAGREDIYATERFERGKRFVETVYEPLKDDVLRRHVRGEITVQSYVQRPNATVRFCVMDFDISKKILLRHEKGSHEFAAHLRKCLDMAAVVKKGLSTWGLVSYLEFSGYRGYHLWIFFREWIPVRYVNLLQERIERQIISSALHDGDIQMEFFPNRGKYKGDKPGQCIKLPYGVHTKSLETSYFLEKDGSAVTDVNRYFKDIVGYSLSEIKKILGRVAIQGGPVEREGEGKIADEAEDIVAVFGEVEPKVGEILCNCSLMRYLCQKASKTGYIGHFERQSILYVFGHLGEGGKQFVHKVMEFTVNYQYSITEKFIRRLPDKPVSCIKLREQYKTVTAEFGCNCNFKGTANCYPSPVLHAIKNTVEDVSDITVPISRSLSRTNEKRVVEELNVHKRVQDLSVRILELKKQKRGVDKAIEKLEKEVELIFDQMKTDCMEIESGLLVRRRKEDGYEWLIEL